MNSFDSNKRYFSYGLHIFCSIVPIQSLFKKTHCQKHIIFTSTTDQKSTIYLKLFKLNFKKDQSIVNFIPPKLLNEDTS